MRWLSASTLSSGLAAMAFFVAASAAAVTLHPGEGAAFRRYMDGATLVPPINQAGDPSLAGAVVASQTVAFTIPVKVFDRDGNVSDMQVQGYLDDWVVRREDTGLLDFYLQVHAEGWAGLLTRHWAMGDSLAMEVATRDDLPLDLPLNGTLPDGISLSHDGQAVQAEYHATDWGSPNWVYGQSAPVLMRSSLHDFQLSQGQLSYLYTDEFRSAGGTTAVTLYAPVPEPSTLALTLAGGAALGLRRRLKAAAAARR